MTEKDDAPIICPLLSIASPQEDEYADCSKEACWFYNRALKKCVWVHMAISLQRLADALGKGDLKQVMPSVKDQIIQSLRRQHRP